MRDVWVASYGFNTVFLQVRPNSDVLYPSKPFPWSACLASRQGLAPDSDFDPAVPEVRQLIIDGTKELLENYDVDGIRIDDYFYPYPDFVLGKRTRIRRFYHPFELVGGPNRTFRR